MSKTKDDEKVTTPFPTAPISNGEWVPNIQVSKKQVLAHQLTMEECDVQAKRHAMTRAQFLRTAAATMIGFSVLNKINGLDAWGDNAVLPVMKVHCEDLDAASERLSTKPYFIVDVQSHFVDAEEFNIGAFCSLLRFCNEPGDPTCAEDATRVGQTNYIKEMFVDSETHVGVISGLPSGVPLGQEKAAETRDLVNSMANSERCIIQAMIDPAPPSIPNPNFRTGIDSMEFQVNTLGGRAIKCYSYNGNWRLDDENIAYPMFAEAERLGIGLINTHKGLPAIFAPGSEEAVRTTDYPKALADWPKLRFCAYHSGYFTAGQHPEGKDGVTEFVEMAAALPKKHRKRLYAEIGSSFAITLLSDDGTLACGNGGPPPVGPVNTAHFIGQLLNTFGSKNILWGTDSIWWGSPQWLLDAFKIMQIPVSLQEQFGYPELKERDKKRILGKNASKLYRIKRSTRNNLCSIPEDQLQQAQVARGGAHASRSLDVYGPMTRSGFIHKFGTSIG